MIIDKILARGVFEEGNKESAVYMRYTCDFDVKTGTIIINLQTASADKFSGNSIEVSDKQEEIRKYMCKKLLNELKVFLPNRNTNESLVVIDAGYEKFVIRPEAFRCIEEYERNNSDEHLVNIGCDELSEAVVIINNFYALYFSEIDSAILFAVIFKNEWESYVCYHNPLSKSFFISTNLFNSSIENSSDNPQRIMISGYLADQLRFAYKYRIGIILNKNPADFITDTNYQNGFGVSFMLSDADLELLRTKVTRVVNQITMTSEIYTTAIGRLIPADARLGSYSSASGYDSEEGDESEDEEQSTTGSEVAEESDNEKQSITESEASDMDYDAKRFLPPWAAVLSGTPAVASTSNVERISGEEKSPKAFSSSDVFAPPSFNSSAQNNAITSTTKSEESEEIDAGNQLRPPREGSKASSLSKSEEPICSEESDVDDRENTVSKAAIKSLAEVSPPTGKNNTELKSGLIDNRIVNVAAQNIANPHIYKDKSKVVLNELQNRVYGRIDRVLPYAQKQFYLNEIKFIIGSSYDIEILSDIYHFINYEPNKKALNVHKNSIRDMVFFKNNTNSWQELIEIIRKQAFKTLLNNLGISDFAIDHILNQGNTSSEGNNTFVIPNPQRVIDILSPYLEDKLFCEHRSNNFFRNNFHATTAVKNLRKIISVCEVQKKRESQTVFELG